MTDVAGQDAISSDDAEGLLLGQAPAELTEVARLLRQAREAQGISLADLAQRLHMGLQQLQALEMADRAALPEPVFVIAQARRIADALGLEVSDSIDRLRRSEAFSNQGPPLKPEAFARSSQAANKASASVRATATASAPATAARPTEAQAWRRALLVVLGALGAGGSIAVWQLQRQQVPWPASTRPAPVAASVASKPKPKPQLEAVLLLQASQPSWLEVRSQAGGAVLFRGTLVGARRFGLAQGLRVLAGRPDRVLVSQGSAAPRVLGPISAVQWFSFGVGPQR